MAVIAKSIFIPPRYRESSPLFKSLKKLLPVHSTNAQEGVVYISIFLISRLYPSCDILPVRRHHHPEDPEGGSFS